MYKLVYVCHFGRYCFPARQPRVVLPLTSPVHSSSVVLGGILRSVLSCAQCYQRLHHFQQLSHIISKITI